MSTLPTDLLLATLPKVVLPAVAIGIMVFVARKRGISLTDDVGLRAPRPKFAAIFLVAWIALISIEEYATAGVGGTAAKIWPPYPLIILVLRILAIGVLGPIAEELAFRGLLLQLLGRTRIGIFGAIVLTAAVWSLIHLQYAPLLLALIFIDGIVLGLARHFTKSLYVPIAMHVIGNLFSIYQSLHP